MRFSFSPATLTRVGITLGLACLLAAFSVLVMRWLDPVLLTHLQHKEINIFGVSRVLILVVLQTAVGLGLAELLRQDLLAHTRLESRVLAAATFLSYASFFAALFITGLDFYIGKDNAINRGVTGLAFGALGVGISAASARYSTIVAAHPGAPMLDRVRAVLLADLLVAFGADLLALVLTRLLSAASLLSFVGAVLAVAGFVAATNARPSVVEPAASAVAVASGTDEGSR